jgi:hypothetical protein
VDKKDKKKQGQEGKARINVHLLQEIKGKREGKRIESGGCGIMNERSVESMDGCFARRSRASETSNGRTALPRDQVKNKKDKDEKRSAIIRRNMMAKQWEQ